MCSRLVLDCLPQGRQEHKNWRDSAICPVLVLRPMDVDEETPQNASCDPPLFIYT